MRRSRSGAALPQTMQCGWRGLQEELQGEGRGGLGPRAGSLCVLAAGRGLLVGRHTQIVFVRLGKELKQFSSISSGNAENKWKICKVPCLKVL